MKRFEKVHFHCYGGAMKFPDGSDPFISDNVKFDGEEVDIVAAGGHGGMQGISVFVPKVVDGVDACVEYSRETPDAVTLLDILERLGRIDLADLLALGFEPH